MINKDSSHSHIQLKPTTYNKVTRKENTMFLYCIEHEEMVKLEQGHFCTGHTYVVYNETETGFSDLDFHCWPFPFAYCPPPMPLFSGDLDDLGGKGWSDWCEQNTPSPKELEVTDIKAKELEREFGEEEEWLTI